ncbi:MAG: alpha/beta hydrolase [Myxococcota bacterium]
MSVHRLPDGRDLTYDLVGASGKPLFWLHGSPSGRGEAHVHRAAAERLGWALCAVDRPGMGGSTRADVPGLAAFAGDLAHLADALGWQRFVVAGASGGGPYALAVAARLPARVRHAVLLAGAGQMEEARDAAGWVDRMTSVLLERAPGLIAAWLHTVRAMAWVGAGLPGRLGALARVPRDALRPGVAGALDDLRVLHRPWDVDLGTIAVPVTLVQGTRDAFVPLRHAERLAAAIPRSKLVRRPGEGHLRVCFDLEGALAAAGLQRAEARSAMVQPP